MSQFEKLLASIRNNPRDVRFEDALRVARHYFVERTGGKHAHVFTRSGWVGALNFQRRSDGKAKPYQVQQLLDALDELELDAR